MVVADFSVLISIYIKADPSHFRLALNSLVRQTLQPSEFVIVCDGPITDDLERIISDFHAVYKNDPRININLVRLPVNKGLGMALRVGLNACKNKIVARFDADDICFEERFEKQYHYFVKNGIDVLGTFMEEFKVFPGDTSQYHIQPTEHIDIVSKSKYFNPICHPTVMFDKTKVIKHGSYDHMPLFEDYYLWIRLLQNNLVFANLPLPLVYFRVGDNMILRRSGLNYYRCEFDFYKAALKIHHISIIQFLSIVGIKFFLRILPPAVLLFVYKIFSRKTKYS